jgi:hypothetical protein
LFFVQTHRSVIVTVILISLSNERVIWLNSLRSKFLVLCFSDKVFGLRLVCSARASGPKRKAWGVSPRKLGRLKPQPVKRARVVPVFHSIIKLSPTPRA